jgi:hypothetical protein
VVLKRGETIGSENPKPADGAKRKCQQIQIEAEVPKEMPVENRANDNPNFREEANQPNRIVKRAKHFSFA